MFLEPVLALVLTLGTAIAQNCGAHPAVDTKLAKCSTVTPFCESLLGRSGSTTTISLATYTSTIPKSTLTYLELITSTIHTSAFVATRTVTTTYVFLRYQFPPFSPILTCHKNIRLCMNGTIPAPTVDVMIAQSAAAAAAGSSCGVGTYSAAWVTTACDCALDSTVYVASTTQKVKKGTTLIITSTTERYTVSIQKQPTSPTGGSNKSSVTRSCTADSYVSMQKDHFHLLRHHRHGHGHCHQRQLRTTRRRRMLES